MHFERLRLSQVFFWFLLCLFRLSDWLQYPEYCIRFNMFLVINYRTWSAYFKHIVLYSKIFGNPNWVSYYLQYCWITTRRSGSCKESEQKKDKEQWTKRVSHVNMVQGFQNNQRHLPRNVTIRLLGLNWRVMRESWEYLGESLLFWLLKDCRCGRAALTRHREIQESYIPFVRPLFWYCPWSFIHVTESIFILLTHNLLEAPSKANLYLNTAIQSLSTLSPLSWQRTYFGWSKYGYHYTPNCRYKKLRARGIL